MAGIRASSWNADSPSASACANWPLMTRWACSSSRKRGRWAAVAEAARSRSGRHRRGRGYARRTRPGLGACDPAWGRHPRRISVGICVQAASRRLASSEQQRFRQGQHRQASPSRYSVRSLRAREEVGPRRLATAGRAGPRCQPTSHLEKAVAMGRAKQGGRRRGRQSADRQGRAGPVAGAGRGQTDDSSPGWRSRPVSAPSQRPRSGGPDHPN